MDCNYCYLAMEVVGKMNGRVQIAVVGSGDDRTEPAVSHAQVRGELVARQG